MGFAIWINTSIWIECGVIICDDLAACMAFIYKCDGPLRFTSRRSRICLFLVNDSIRFVAFGRCPDAKNFQFLNRICICENYSTIEIYLAIRFWLAGARMSDIHDAIRPFTVNPSSYCFFSITIDLCVRVNEWVYERAFVTFQCAAHRGTCRSAILHARPSSRPFGLAYGNRSHRAMVK